MTVWEVRELLREPSDWHMERSDEYVEKMVHYSGRFFYTGSSCIFLAEFTNDPMSFANIVWRSNPFTWLLVMFRANRIVREAA